MGREDEASGNLQTYHYLLSGNHLLCMKRWEGEENVFHKILLMMLYIYCIDYIMGAILKRGSVLSVLWFSGTCQPGDKKSAKPIRANQYVTT